MKYDVKLCDFYEATDDISRACWRYAFKQIWNVMTCADDAGMASTIFLPRAVQQNATRQRAAWLVAIYHFWIGSALDISKTRIEAVDICRTASAQRRRLLCRDAIW